MPRRRSLRRQRGGNKPSLDALKNMSQNIISAEFHLTKPIYDIEDSSYIWDHETVDYNNIPCRELYENIIYLLGIQIQEFITDADWIEVVDYLNSYKFYVDQCDTRYNPTTPNNISLSLVIEGRQHTPYEYELKDFYESPIFSMDLFNKMYENQLYTVTDAISERIRDIEDLIEEGVPEYVKRLLLINKVALECKSPIASQQDLSELVHKLLHISFMFPTARGDNYRFMRDNIMAMTNKYKERLTLQNRCRIVLEENNLISPELRERLNRL